MNDDDDEILAIRKPKGRGMGYKHTQIARERIRVGALLSRLSKHVQGKVEMSMSQIRAAEILLRKALPDLSAVEHTGAIEHRHVTDMSDAELLTIAAGRGEGTAEATLRAPEPPELH